MAPLGIGFKRHDNCNVMPLTNTQQPKLAAG